MFYRDIWVKGNLEWSDPVPVRISSRTALSDATIDRIKEMRLIDAQKHCQRVLNAVLTVGHPK